MQEEDLVDSPFPESLNGEGNYFKRKKMGIRLKFGKQTLQLTITMVQNSMRDSRLHQKHYFL